jgi:hypothetical protein
MVIVIRRKRYWLWRAVDNERGSGLPRPKTARCQSSGAKVDEEADQEAGLRTKPGG